jgi:regulatory protein
MVKRQGSRSTASEPNRRTPRGSSGEASSESAPERAHAAAVRMLARAPRAAAEVAAHLTRHGFAPAIVDATLLRLRDLRYIDDDTLARRRAEDLLLRRGYGRLRVAHELTRRGVADSVVETAIAAVSEGRRDAEFARRALHRKFGEASLTDASARARAYRFLIGRGHPTEAVADVLGDDDSR